MERTTPDVTAILQHVAKQLAGVGERIQKAVNSIDLKAVEARLDALQGEAVQLGKEGWTLPMWATPGEVGDILAESKRRPVDEVFEDYFGFEEGLFYKQLKRSLVGKASLAKRRSLIEQCFWAYEHERFLVVVPAMITVVEGVVIDAGGAKAVKEKDPKQTAKRIAANVGEDSLKQAIWTSIDAFVSELFDNISFSGPRPVEINRAWILHGRADPNWTKADCLRLFQAADTIAR